MKITKLLEALSSSDMKDLTSACIDEITSSPSDFFHFEVGDDGTDDNGYPYSLIGTAMLDDIHALILDYASSDYLDLADFDEKDMKKYVPKIIGALKGKKMRNILRVERMDDSNNFEGKVDKVNQGRSNTSGSLGRGFPTVKSGKPAIIIKLEDVQLD